MPRPPPHSLCDAMNNEHNQIIFHLAKIHRLSLCVEWTTNIKYLATLMKTSYIIAQSKPLKPMENQPAPFATYEYNCLQVFPV